MKRRLSTCSICGLLLISVGLSSCKQESKSEASIPTVLAERIIGAPNPVIPDGYKEVMLPYAKTIVPKILQLKTESIQTGNDSSIACSITDGTRLEWEIKFPKLNENGNSSWDISYEALSSLIDTIQTQTPLDQKRKKIIAGMFQEGGNVIPFKSDEICGFASIPKANIKLSTIYIYNLSKTKFALITFASDSPVDESVIWHFLEHWEWKESEKAAH